MMASAASHRKGSKIQQDFSRFCQKKIPKQSDISPQILDDWMTLKTSVVISSPWNSFGLIDLGGFCNLTGLNSPLSSKNFRTLIL